MPDPKDKSERTLMAEEALKNARKSGDLKTYHQAAQAVRKYEDKLRELHISEFLSPNAVKIASNTLFAREQNIKKDKAAHVPLEQIPEIDTLHYGSITLAAEGKEKGPKPLLTYYDFATYEESKTAHQLNRELGDAKDRAGKIVAEVMKAHGYEFDPNKKTIQGISRQGRNLTLHANILNDVLRSPDEDEETPAKAAEPSAAEHLPDEHSGQLPSQKTPPKPPQPKRSGIKRQGAKPAARQ